MRKFLIFVFIAFITSLSLQAQVGRGSIYGTVGDDNGEPLPGVTVTLTGSITAPIHSVTGATGAFRFLTLPPAGDYAIRAVLQGFKTKVIKDISVAYGQNVNVNITLELGELEEEVTVIAEKPVIDKKRTEVGLLVTQEIMQELPIPRDIWMMEKISPGTTQRYWNIGGAESLEQDQAVSRGDPEKYMAGYLVDGINVVDLAARGATANYLNMDAIEEIKIVTGGAADVTVQSGGVATDAIIKRGGDRPNLGARFFLTDKTFQADNLTDRAREAGMENMVRINETKEAGFNYGFPIIKGKAWFFLAWDYQEVKKWTVHDFADDAFQWSFDLKLNLQLIPQNRFEAYVRSFIKKRFGDEPMPERPEGLYKGPKSRFGNPLYKFQVEHTFGDDLYVTAKFVSYGGWMSWLPMTDIEGQKLAYFNVARGVRENSWEGEWATRPNKRFQFLADYFNNNLFGVAHQLRIGGEYTHHSTESESGFAGNALVNYNYNVPTVDYDGDETPDIYPDIKRIQVRRGSHTSRTTRAYALFLQDTISFKNFTAALGLRYDYQWPRSDASEYLTVLPDHPVWKTNFTQSTGDAINQILPALEVGEIKATDAEGKDYRWANLSPRFSFTWDLKGDGKTILKFSAARYHEWMGSGEGGTWSKGGTGGWMDFWWLDTNQDGIIDFTELNWHRSATYSLYRVYDDAGNFIGDLEDAQGIMYGAYDPENPQKTTDPYTVVDRKVTAPRTSEIQLTVERELFADFALQVNAAFRRYDWYNWDLLYFPETGEIESQDWYMSAGKPPASIPGLGDTEDAKDHEWYVLKPEYGYTPWEYRTRRPDYRADWYGVDFIFTKRLSNRWMFNGSFTLQTQRMHFGDEGMTNPTNKWALEGRGYAAGGSAGSTRWTPGRIDHPTWMLKVMGLYQIPFGIDVSLTWILQQGRKVREGFEIVDYSLPNPRSNSAYVFMEPLGTDHSDMPNLINLGIQKRMKFLDFGQVTFMLDIQNLLNSDCIHWRLGKDHGKYTVQGDLWAPNAVYYNAIDSFGGRIARLGVRISF